MSINPVSLVITAGSTVLSCGHPPPEYPKVKISQPSRQAVIFAVPSGDGYLQTTVLQPEIKIEGGSIPSAGFVYPVPSEPTLGIASPGLIKAYQDLTKPKYAGVRFLGGGGNPAYGGEFSVTNQGSLGNYDYAVIRPEGEKAAEAVNSWLGENGFSQVPPENLKFYADKNREGGSWHFVAIKIKQKMSEGEKNYTPDPLVMTFHTKKITDPVKFLTHAGSMTLSYYLNTLQPVDRFLVSKESRLIKPEDRGPWVQTAYVLDSLPPESEELLTRLAKDYPELGQMLDGRPLFVTRFETETLVNTERNPITDWKQDVEFVERPLMTPTIQALLSGTSRLRTVAQNIDGDPSTFTNAELIVGAAALHNLLQQHKPGEVTANMLSSEAERFITVRNDSEARSDYVSREMIHDVTSSEPAVQDRTYRAQNVLGTARLVASTYDAVDTVRKALAGRKTVPLIVWVASNSGWSYWSRKEVPVSHIAGLYPASYTPRDPDRLLPDGKPIPNASIKVVVFEKGKRTDYFLDSDFADSLFPLRMSTSAGNLTPLQVVDYHLEKAINVKDVEAVTWHLREAQRCAESDEIDANGDYQKRVERAFKEITDNHYIQPAIEAARSDSKTVAEHYLSGLKNFLAQFNRVVDPDLVKDVFRAGHRVWNPSEQTRIRQSLGLD